MLFRSNAATDTIPLVPFPSPEVQYLDAHEEENFRIAQASTPTDDFGNLTAPRIEVRWGDKLLLSNPVDIDYIDVSPRQIVSVAAAMIPFLEHDDANRALMGSNMQRQAVPLLQTDSPLVGTGLEREVARNAGTVVVAERSEEHTSELQSH